MREPLRVLIAEDSEDDAFLLVDCLRKAGYDPAFERIETLDAMVVAVKNRSWDIVICDHSMPRFSPLDALGVLKGEHLDVPLVIVSGTIEGEAAVTAMKAGAKDFIMKDDRTRLIPAIQRELQEAKNRQDKRKAEEKFLQSQKMESVGRLAGGVAHDFNNLLTAILGYSSLLLQGLDPQDAHRSDVQEIRNAAERASLLTRQLLAFSRQQVVEMTLVDINRVLPNMESLLRRLIGEDIELALVLESGIGKFKGDVGQIEQVIMNLCVNARDAMPHGGKLILETALMKVDPQFAERHPPLSPGSYVTFSVTDTGTGMDKGVIAKIFEPFFTTKPTGKGTGLGLSTVFDIVKLCSGHVLVESELGRGSTFKVFFPKAGSSVEIERTDSGSNENPRGTETILLVEDEAGVRNLTSRILKKQGYTVLEAKNGEDALALGADRSKRIDLMITDVVMPQMSGPDLAKKIASNLPGLKVLYVSGYTDELVADKGVLKPGIAFLQKPYAHDALSRKIREILDAKPG